MSAESFAHDNSEAKMPSRFLHYFDLHGVWGMYAVVVTNTIISSIPGMTDQFDTTFWIILSITITYMVALFAAGRRHQVGLCGHCFDAFPLDPGAYAATRARLALRTTHVVGDRIDRSYRFLERVLRYQALVFIVGVATMFGAAWLIGLVLREWFGPVFLGALILYGYAVQKHRKFQLWCPWCDHGRGDDDDDEPEPQPEPTGNATHTTNA